jgi:hypothetical protein
MKGKRFRWSGSLRKRCVPRDMLSYGNQLKGSNHQRGHVQRLADGADCIRRAGMLVQEYSARGEIQQRHAAQYGQRATPAPLPETKPPRVHTPIPSVYQLRRVKKRVGCTK